MYTKISSSFTSEDILTCHGRERTGGSNKMNDLSWVPGKRTDAVNVRK